MSNIKAFGAVLGNVKRTTIWLWDDLHALAKEAAKERRISMSDLIRVSLAKELERTGKLSEDQRKILEK